MIEKMQMVHIVTTTSGKQEMLKGLREIGILHLSERKSADKETADMCIKAVASIPGLNFAGVDIMKTLTDDGEEIRYFIEINSNPGEKIMDITGHNHYEELLDFVEAECRKRSANKKADKEENRPGDDDGDEAPAKTFEDAYKACKESMNRMKARNL